MHVHAHVHVHVCYYLPYVFMTAVCYHQTEQHISKLYGLEARLDTAPIENADRALQEILQDKKGAHKAVIKCASTFASPTHSHPLPFL